MGLVRMLLALAVVLAHCDIAQMVGGRTAVRIFYLISGYLMSHILVERAAYASLGRFYANRWLRLFPLYWLVAAVTLGLFVLAPQIPEAAAFFATYRQAGSWGALDLAVSNVTLFGQDWIMFTGVDHGQLRLVANFREAGLQMYQGLLVPQAWTLGVEISFYLIAPLVLVRRRWIYALLGLSLGARLYLFRLGLGQVDPWTYRFFPAELALFLCGALSHQLLKPRYERWLGAHLPGAARVATWTIASLIIGCAALPYAKASSYLLIGLCALAIPLLFEFQKGNRWDRFLGEFSYPVYIIHGLAIATAPLLTGPLWDRSVARPYQQAAIAITITCAASYLVIRWFNPLFERQRDRMRRIAPG